MKKVKANTVLSHTRSDPVISCTSNWCGALLLAFLLTACGGGGGGSAPANAFAQKAWSTAALIETDNGTTSGPQIALNDSGNALAVWRSGDNIWANHYTDGAGWGTAELIDNAAAPISHQIAFDASGNAMVVWEGSDGTRYNIWSKRYTVGTGWGTAELIETDDTGHAYDPQIAVDASGNAMAVWRQFDGTRYNIWSNRYTVGAGWSAAGLIETDNAGNARNPKIVVDASGNAMAVWDQSDGTRYSIWANRYTTAGWGIAALIEADNTGGAEGPQIAVDSSGNALAVWFQHDGTRNNIWSNRYTVGTGWGTAELIETDDTGNAFSPQIEFDASGNALAVWDQSDGTRYNIWSNRYAIGTGWGTAGLIETDNAGNAYNPQIAFDANGNALAVWEQSGGMINNIWSNRYIVGTGWGTAELIETDNAGTSGNPQIAVDANGNALAVWWQFDGTRYNTWANRYE